MSGAEYTGSELALFARAENWKRYWSALAIPFLHGDVMEVGAGIGSNTLRLRHFTPGRWLCIEPNAALAAELARNLGDLRKYVEIFNRAIEFLPTSDLFDFIFYVDVLEHIADDAGDLVRAKARLRPGGHLFVLAPANQRVFSDFDRAVGHLRRYSKRSLLAIQPQGLILQRICYLDSAGLLLLALNRALLKSGTPTCGQIFFWDRVAVRISKITDYVLGYRVGKTIVAVWQKEHDPFDAAPH